MTTKRSLGRFGLLSLALAATAVAQPALTIYNQDFAVVRERVPLDLKAGENAVTFAGATLQLEPDSVVLRDPAGVVRFQVLEQSYRADVMSQGLLLSLNEGRELEFIVRDRDAKEYVVRGKVIRSGYMPGGRQTSPIIEVEGKLRFSLPGEPLFPVLAGDGILKPTLSWKIGADSAAKFEAELGYITGGLSWNAAYNMVAPEKGDTLDIVGWVTMENQSGKRFENAAVKLMAGNVSRVQPERPAPGDEVRMRAFAVAAAPVTEKAFDEFHLYSLARPVTLRDQETKQVEFMRATGVKAPVIYVYDGASNFGRRYGGGMIRDPGYGAQPGAKTVWVMREFRNSEENHLGLPLPEGRMRFYRRDDADGRIEFTGENEIGHTPRNELLRVRTGDAFDIVGERTRTDFNLSSRQDFAEEAFEIEVRNRKSEPVEVRVVEHLYRWVNWTIVAQSDDFTKQDAQTIEFRVPVKPDEERKVTYRVRYDWR